MKPLVIIGTGGYIREVIDVVEAINHRSPEYQCLGFVVDGFVVNERISRLWLRFGETFWGALSRTQGD